MGLGGAGIRSFGPVPDHIPPARRGIRGTLGEDIKERLRRQIGQMLTR